MAEEKTIKELNHDLGNLLTSVETRAAEIAEEKRQTSKLAQTQKELRARYETVEPVLKEAARLEKELRPYVARIGPALDALEREGVRQELILPVRRKLDDLNLRLGTMLWQSRAIPELIAALEPQYDTPGNVFGAAEIDSKLRMAGGLVAAIHEHHQQLVNGLAEATKAQRHAVKMVSIEPPEFKPAEPVKVETDFPIFG